MNKKRVHKGGVNTLLIPTGLMQVIIRDSYWNPSKVWLASKMLYGSSFKDNVECRRNIAKLLGISERTVVRSLKNLHQRKWVGYNGYRYFMRSIHYVSQLELVNIRTSTVIKASDLPYVRGYAYAACAAELIRGQRVAKKRAIGGERELAPKFQTIALPTHYPLSSIAFAKITGIAKSKADKLRAYANNIGYISMKENFDEVNTGTISPRQYRQNYREYDLDNTARLVIRNGKLWRQNPNILKSLISLKKRRLRKDKKSIIN